MVKFELYWVTVERKYQGESVTYTFIYRRCMFSQILVGFSYIFEFWVKSMKCCSVIHNGSERMSCIKATHWSLLLLIIKTYILYLQLISMMWQFLHGITIKYTFYFTTRRPVTSHCPPVRQAAIIVVVMTWVVLCDAATLAALWR